LPLSWARAENKGLAPPRSHHRPRRAVLHGLTRRALSREIRVFCATETLERTGLVRSEPSVFSETDLEGLDIADNQPLDARVGFGRPEDSHGRIAK